MIILDSTTESLEILLAGAVTTNQLPFTASYADHNATAPSFTPGSSDGQTNGTTAVTLVGNPGAGVQRQVKRLNVYNADTAQATVTIRLNNGGTLRTQFAITIQTGERIEYEDGVGFSVYTVTGARKVTAVASTVEPGYIDGLVMIWNSATSLTVSNGTAYIPSVGANVNFPASITKAALVLSAATTYHVYGFLNSGVPDIEIVTTAPDAPYNGTARTKTGDTTRRYIGSIRSVAANDMQQFLQSDTVIQYLYDSVTTGRILSGGVATVITTVSLSSVIPPTARSAQLNVINGTTSAAMITRTSDQPLVGGAGGGPFRILSLNATESARTFHPTNASQEIQYQLLAAPGAGGVFVDVLGYQYAR